MSHASFSTDGAAFEGAGANKSVARPHARRIQEVSLVV